MHPQSLAEGEIKTESDVLEGMEVSMRSKVPDPPGSAERVPVPQKRKVSSPTHSSNGHSPADTSPSPMKKKKKPGAMSSHNKDQSELRHGPFYYAKQPALATDPVDVVPQDGRNDFYCWLCHREGQVLCCELCPRVYHAKCLKLPAEPEGDWFCPECEKITVAECIETQSKAMTMLTIDQLSYLLKFALQKMKQPGNVKKKMYGCTEAFLADMNEIEVCPECYLSSCQKRDNWFCEPCSQPHPLVWAKLKGFPFWPAKALREKDGQEIPFSVKKTKSIFNSAMQEMEVYVENIHKKFGVFNYAPFRTPFTPHNQLQMLLDPANPGAGTVKLEKPEKLRLNFDITISPKMLLQGKSFVGGAPGGGGRGGGGGLSRRISMTDMPRSPMSTNSSVPGSGSDAEPDCNEKPPRSLPFHYSTGEDSMDFSASPASSKIGPAGSTTGSPKPFNPGLIPEDAYKGVERSDSEDSDKSDSSDSPYPSDDEHKPKSSTHEDKDKLESRRLPRTSGQGEDKEGGPDTGDKVTPDPPLKDKQGNNGPERNPQDKPRVASAVGAAPQGQPPPEMTKSPEGGRSAAAPTSHAEQDSDSERELVIDLGDENGGRDRKRLKKEPATSKVAKDPSAIKTEASPARDASTPKDSSSQAPLTAALSPASTTVPAQTTAAPVWSPPAPSPSSSSSTSTTTSSNTTTSTSATAAAPAAATKKQRPLLPKETAQAVQQRTAVVWNPTSKLPTASFKKVQVQKLQSQQHAEQQQQQPPVLAAVAIAPTQVTAPLQAHSPQQQQNQNSPSSTRYQTRQAAKVLQKDSATSSAAPAGGSSSSSSSSSSLSLLTGDLQIPTGSADVAADITKYTNKSLEQERERLVAEVKKQTESDKQQAVDETKKKQWCANCRKEAIFYCCWNTSYCDYPSAHWPEHMKSCTQSATAPQQEPETEPASDPTAKPASLPPATIPSAAAVVAASLPDKNSSPRYLEKSKDSTAGVTVT
ncbi:LOW QUALITY PROTEIN: hypothetical protein CRUP_013069 [Coryphaenoides rupestris]|nr:LOW QUALITY PROTEIN: hypothetical protein CRUP_013069 [Coryphaenoides rupestris]